MSVLILNAGSSSLKFTLLEAGSENVAASGQVTWPGKQAELQIRKGGDSDRRQIEGSGYASATEQILSALGTFKSEIECVGHRVVHGGSHFRESVRIDAAVKAAIASLSKEAPLHNPIALEVINAAESSLPALQQVAVFDTSFFSRMEESAYLYPVPYAWHTEWGVRRFGFHGISHSWSAGRAAALSGTPANLRVVSCHLGNGCSVTASRNGVAVSTSMGFTPMDGVMMGTRSGAVDPGILLYAMRERGVTAEQLDDTLNNHSGLLGVSGLSGDFREIEQAIAKGHARARLAFTMYAVSVRATIGAMAVTLGGIDALVFTGGVGENSAALRSEVCHGLECLNIHLNAAHNQGGLPETDLAKPSSVARIFIVTAREDIMIARDCRRVLDAK